MSWKDDFVVNFGEEAYIKRLERRKKWGGNLPGGEAQRSRERREEDPEMSWQSDRIGGRYYERKLEYNRTGLRGERNKIRHKHGKRWSEYKRIIAPASVLHHEWQSQTAEYNGVALVEKKAHMYGIINVIQIMDGKITLLPEKDITK